jgi:hypothetical protein
MAYVSAFNRLVRPRSVDTADQTGTTVAYRDERMPLSSLRRRKQQTQSSGLLTFSYAHSPNIVFLERSGL